jgi:hypothetical protein
MIVMAAEYMWNVDQDLEGGKKFFENLSRIEYSDKTGSLIGTMVDLSMAQPQKQVGAPLWYCNILFHFLREAYRIEGSELYPWDIEQSAVDISEDLLKLEEKAMDSINILLRIKCDCPADKRKYIDQFINTARGVKVLSRATGALRGYTRLPAPDIAEEMEIWLEEFCDIWRRDNKESELFEIIKIVRSVGKYLRNPNTLK